MTDLDALTALAQAANTETEGEWYGSNGEHYIDPLSDPYERHSVAFIAAVDPQTVLGLVERVKHLERWGDAASRTAEMWQKDCLAQRSRADAAEARVRELEANLEKWKRMYDCEFKEADKLGDEFVALERAHANFRAKIRALADEWADDFYEGPMVNGQKTEYRVRSEHGRCAELLRTLLGENND